MTELNFWGSTFFPSESVEICESPCSCYYFYQMLKMCQSSSLVVKQYYRSIKKQKTLADATERQMINILVAHMIDTHRYFNYYYIYFF